MVDHAGRTDGTIAVYAYGRIEIQFQRFVSQSRWFADHPFRDDAARLEMLRRINELEGVQIDTTKIAVRPSIGLGVLIDPQNRARFIELLEWVVSQLRALPGV